MKKCECKKGGEVSEKDGGVYKKERLKDANIILNATETLVSGAERQTPIFF